MASLNLKAGGLPIKIDLPPSKSYANRAIILAALQKKIITLSNLPQADDVTLLIQALQEVGLKFEEKNHQLKVLNSFPDCEKGNSINIEPIYVGEGGTTARFLAVMLALGQRAYTLKLGPRLSKRPWKELVDKLNELGARVELQSDQLFIQGPIKLPREIEINCLETTQVATAFQLALAFQRTVIKPTQLNSSESYWKMTKAMVEIFNSTDSYKIPIDWSSASYPLVFGALKQEIFFPELHPDSLQADSKLLMILDKMGAITHKEKGIYIKPGKRQGDIKFDCSDCLDLVPALVFYLCHIQGVHELTGLENLVHKESDRLGELYSLMLKFNIQCLRNSHSLKIHGLCDLKLDPTDLIFPDDHRLVMTGALFLRLHAGGSVAPASAVSKSFPHFFNLMLID
jgi:3-phosphoshikimate 1-carboxyvinyltransferase